MMGELPDHLSAAAGEATAPQPSAFSALMRWRDGAQATFLCNNNAGARREEYNFHGLGETYRATSTRLTVEKNGTIAHTEFCDDGNGVMAEHEAFLDAIRTGKSAAHSLDAIAPSLYLAELIESGFSGHVSLPPPELVSPPIVRARTILVDRPEALQNALARLMPTFRYITPDDVHESVDSRSDVEAAIAEDDLHSGTLREPDLERFRADDRLVFHAPGELNDVRWAGSLERTRIATATTHTAIERLCKEGIAPSVIVTLHRCNATRDKLPVMHNWFRYLQSIGVD